LHLEGLRGILALWVYFGHAAILVGCWVPLLTKASVAVDVFILLSGYFVTLTFFSIEKHTDYFNAVKIFYLRRFLRVWPLYAFVLIFFIVFIAQYDGWKGNISTHFLPPWVNAENYLPSHYGPLSLTDILRQLSLLFGVWPTWSISTPIPDWSLSLEFQFYLLFPLLLIFLRKNLVASIVVAFVMAWVAVKLGGLYLDAGKLTHFSQPSNLLYRINIFFLGYLIYHIKKEDVNPTLLFLTLTSVANIDPISVIFVALGAYLLLLDKGLLVQWFNKPLLVFMGKISYTIYISHMLVLIPIGSFLVDQVWFVGMNSYLRFIVLSSFGFFPLVLFTYAIYLLLEKPFIQFGHNMRFK